MKVGIIAPIKFLNEYCITNIQYCLPSLLEDSKEYRDFYIGRKGKGDIIILDCRKPGWKRKPEDWNLVWTALEHLKPSIIILPSYMYNEKETSIVANSFKRDLRRLGVKLAGCLEGTSISEVKKCMRSLKDVDMYAIPSHIYNICKKLDGKPLIYIENHLALEELDGLDGILVTSLPVRLGLEGRLLSDYLPSPPSITFYEKEDKYPMITEKNVEEAVEHYEE